MLRHLRETGCLILKSRKDKKGRALRTGEIQREKYYVYQYTDVLHKRRSIYAKDLPELREKEREVIKDLEDGMDVHMRSTMTLNDAFDLYFSDRGELKHATKLCYQYLYDHYVRPLLGRKLLSKIRYSDVRKFYLILAKEAGLSKKTIGMLHSLLTQTMKAAVRDNILRTNPAENAMSDLAKRVQWDVHKRHALTEEQQTAFMRHVMKKPEFACWATMFTVMLGTGCRIGEVLGLRWDDIDFENKVISIDHSLLYRRLDSGTSGFYVSTPKTAAGKRTIPMMSAVEQAFLRERECQEERNRRNGNHRSPVVDGYTNFVFTKEKKRPLYRASLVNIAIRNIVDSYNQEEARAACREGRPPNLLPDFTCHHLRHTFCTRFCENETNMKVIQDIMGHASITTTMNIYAEATAAKKKECIGNLENKIKIF